MLKNEIKHVPKFDRLSEKVPFNVLFTFVFVKHVDNFVRVNSRIVNGRHRSLLYSVGVLSAFSVLTLVIY